jgi:hypothetical protein
MASVTRYLTRVLRLKVNVLKSRVGRIEGLNLYVRGWMNYLGLSHSYTARWNGWMGW